MARRFREITVGKLVLWIYVVLVVAYSVGPVIVAVGTSLTTTGYPVFPPVGFTWKWYGVFLSSRNLISAFYLSTELATVTAVLTCLIAVVTSYGIVRFDYPGKDYLNALIMGPMLMPEIIIGVSLFEFLGTIGVLRSTEFGSLLIGHVVVTLPYAVRMISGALTKVDVAMERAAINLGATSQRMFRTVIVPLIKPSIFAAGLFTFVLSFDDLPVSLFVGIGHVATFPVTLLNMLEFSIDPSIGAAATFFVVLAVALVLIFERTVGLEFALGQ
jgi:putative spermidine/putrescine transport system permease protein